MELFKQHEHARFDVARGMAALVVFLAHATSIFFLRLIGPDHAVAEAMSMVSRHAVLIFFLMSGNLITRSILLNLRRNQRFDAVEYAAARIARIYPPFLGAIAICAMVWLAIHAAGLPGATSYGLPGDLYRIRESYVVSISEVVRALTMRVGLLQADGPLWSLYIEFHIYVVAMALAALWRGDMFSRAWTVLLGLGALWLLRGQGFYVIVWAMGAATALVRLSPRLVVALCVAALAMLLAMIIGFPHYLIRDVDAFWGQAGQLLCCLLYSAGLFYARYDVTYPRTLVATGNFSYSLYVIHFPLLLLGLSLTQNWIGHSLARTWTAALLSMLVVLVIVVPFAALTEQQGRFKRLLLAYRKRASG